MCNSKSLHDYWNHNEAKDWKKTVKKVLIQLKTAKTFLVIFSLIIYFLLVLMSFNSFYEKMFLFKIFLLLLNFFLI